MAIVTKDQQAGGLEAYRSKYNLTQQEVSQALDHLKIEASKPIPKSHLVRYLVKFQTRKEFDLAVVYHKKLKNMHPANYEEARQEIDRMEGILPVSKNIDWSKTISAMIRFIVDGKYSKIEISKTIDFFLSGKGGKFFPTAPEFNIQLLESRQTLKNTLRKLGHSFEVYKNEKVKQGFYNRFDGL